MNSPNCISKTALFAMLIIVAATQAFAVDNWQLLDGQWRFALDLKNEGVTNKWFQEDLEDQIQLPGTTDENRKGTPNEARETDRLTRLFPYAGAAWYQRDFEVPAAWSGKRIVLSLERTKTSRLWLDGNAIGEQNSLVAPHEYILGTLAQGRHTITLRINNAEHPPIGDPHQISEHTQTNWNGVIGKIGLKATDPVWIDDVQVYPLGLEASRKAVRVKISLGNASGKSGKGKLIFSVKGEGVSSSPPPADVAWDENGGKAEIEVPLGDKAMWWDEFQPALNTMNVQLRADGIADEQTVTFGLRHFTAMGTQFCINGRPTFLRGKHEACVFPLTGYPPMTVDGWRRVFKIAKTYGINHYRFHSWCPPEAAFEAADQLGLYIQAELPNWMTFGNPQHDDFMRAEGERILRCFGNHPSFVMLSLGNELGGKQEIMAPFIKHFRELDNRHLYVQGTNNWFPKPDKGDDYMASFQVNGKKVRGSFATVDPPLGHVQLGPPSTQKDYTAEIAAVSVPVVGHEIGEYQTAPDFREIEKYTGVLKPRNLETFRKRLEDKGMSNLADDFLRASGALVVLCYREDIEAALRTRGFGGFQLLDLEDFPGQGTALVGILNAFMESKGLIEPAKWREFCSETVPLVRMPKHAWTNSETFTATAQAAHYGASDINNAAPAWTLRDSEGRTLASGRLPTAKIPLGTLTSLGEIRIPLEDISTPAKLNLELAIQGTNFKNSYDIWLYPDAVDIAPGKVVVSRALDDSALKSLASGGRVLLLPEPDKLANSIEGAFAPDFWNYGMFRKFASQRNKPIAPGTLGILCDPKHPAFGSFPTDFHSNWQWFHLLKNSRAIILDEMPKEYQPLLQVIDNYERLHKLATIFEVQVGPGKLLVCSIDLAAHQDKPEARQLLHSLLKYMNSDQFNPATTVDEATIQRILQIRQ
jgi:hypothetical protein